MEDAMTFAPTPTAYVGKLTGDDDTGSTFDVVQASRSGGDYPVDVVILDPENRYRELMRLALTDEAADTLATKIRAARKETGK
jgi:hypothetical protein